MSYRTQELETFARLEPSFDFSVTNINFKNSGTTECLLPRIKTSLRQIRKKPNSNVPLTEALCPDFGNWAHLSNYTGRTSRILAPFFRLKANCLNIRSIWFFIICVNRALSPLSCRWLIPKYCSM